MKSGTYLIKIAPHIKYIEKHQKIQYGSYNDNYKRFYVMGGCAGKLIGLKSVEILSSPLPLYLKEPLFKFKHFIKRYG